MKMFMTGCKVGFSQSSQATLLCRYLLWLQCYEKIVTSQAARYTRPYVVSALNRHSLLPSIFENRSGSEACLFWHEYYQWCPFGLGGSNDFHGEHSIDILCFELSCLQTGTIRSRMNGWDVVLSSSIWCWTALIDLRWTFQIFSKFLSIF